MEAFLRLTATTGRGFMAVKEPYRHMRRYQGVSVGAFSDCGAAAVSVDSGGPTWPSGVIPSSLAVASALPRDHGFKPLTFPVTPRDQLPNRAFTPSGFSATSGAAAACVF